jgi:DNA-binding NarL/FixJ family response regulator
MPASESASPVVLLVDEDVEARGAIAEHLRDAGFRTLEAGTGHDGLDVARRERPSVVVLDLRLPEVSGYELCLELRDEFGEQLGIVLVSADRVEDLDRVAGFAVGADECLAKPVHAGELLGRLRRLSIRSADVTPLRRLTDLTCREKQVLSLLADGLIQREIARRLVLSDRTVGNHIQNVMAKLNVHSRAQAVALAYRAGLMKPGDEGDRGR